MSDFVWILNPDAELEFLYPGDYTTPKKLALQMSARREQFSRLVRTEPAHFVHELPPCTPRGALFSLFWSATPSVTKLATRLGYRVPRAVERSVLERVTNRRFLFESTLAAPPGRSFVTSAEELDRKLAQLGPHDVWRTKRGFGFAGRGHRTLRGGLIKDDRTFLTDGLRHGGILFEPEVTPTREFSIHGVVTESELVLGEPCALRVDEFSAPLDVERLDAPEPTLRDALVALGAQAAETLKSAGYFGPFGLDVLEVEEAAGRRLWASDLNARFTLGWSTGLGDAREQALSLLLA